MLRFHTQSKLISDTKSIFYDGLHLIYFKDFCTHLATIRITLYPSSTPWQCWYYLLKPAVIPLFFCSVDSGEVAGLLLKIHTVVELAYIYEPYSITLVIKHVSYFQLFFVFSSDKSSSVVFLICSFQRIDQS